MDHSGFSNVKTVGEYEKEILAAWRYFVALAEQAKNFDRCVDLPIRASDNLRISEVSATIVGAAPSSSASASTVVADDAASFYDVAKNEGTLTSAPTDTLADTLPDLPVTTKPDDKPRGGFENLNKKRKDNA